MTTKQSVIELLDKLPENCTLDEIQYHLYVLQTVERGRQEFAQGKKLQHEDSCASSGKSGKAARTEEDWMGQEKTEALELIRKLPDNVTTDAIMEELYFKQQVDKGLQDVAEGRVLTHQELKERLTRWRKSAGR